MNNLETLEQSVIKWAEDKGIFAKATPYKQALKTLEECGELLHAIGMQDSPPKAMPGSPFANAVKGDIADAIGDIAVTIIIQAEMQGLTLTECLQSAYDVIKDRKGKMIDGQFVKEA